MINLIWYEHAPSLNAMGMAESSMFFSAYLISSLHIVRDLSPAHFWPPFGSVGDTRVPWALVLALIGLLASSLHDVD
jgi:hypothetical protein